jgi:hypothetical protein
MGILRLISGIINCLAGLSLCWLVWPLVLIPLGIFEILSAVNLMKDRPKADSGLQTIAILEIVAIVACTPVYSVVTGILTLVWISEPEVKAYLSGLKG